MGVEEFYLLEIETYSPGFPPELQRDEAKPHGPCVLQNTPNLGKSWLWQDRTNSLQRYKEFSSYSSTFPAQCFNVESSSFWACENLKRVFAPAFFHFHLPCFYLFWTSYLDL